MRRKAGDLINEYLRESKLAENRVNPIGEGANAIVYQSDIPGNVMKQGRGRDDGFLTLEEEANLQDVAARMGIAPQIAGVEKFAGGVGNRIEMEDIRKNFETHESDNGLFPTGIDAVRVNQQLGQLALKGVGLGDRHVDNVVYNKMTGRPMQIDFGVAGRVQGSEQAASLALSTAEGFQAAGIGDVADIYLATVMDYLEGGQVTEAMDVAKQGFSRLQKIKRTV
tara:strand:- start:11 stop:682 length:672 start_codon:yes stop_codon:yes gene_type:complete